MTTLTTTARIAADVAPPVAHISLRNPPLNVIDVPMMDELMRTLSELEALPDVSTIVFRGEGTAFSAGVDVAAHTPDKVEQMLAKFHGIVRALIATRKVT